MLRALIHVASRGYIDGTMRTTGIRELKDRLSEYVRLAASGEVVLVTDRGRVVAELRSPGAPSASDEFPPGLRRLVEAGTVTPGAPNDPALYPDSPARARAGAAQRLLDAERADR